jgi:3,4-dihydroxy 2-butanone 4-phosphate synthase/GTP cyclohydrolase II
VTRAVVTRLPTAHGLLDAVGYRDEVTGAEHLALLGPGGHGRPRVVVHSECVLGDVLSSVACGCAGRLRSDLDTVAREGGVLVYVRRPAGEPVTGVGPHRWTAADDGAVGAILADLGHRLVCLRPGPTTPERLARPDLAVRTA